MDIVQTTLAYEKFIQKNIHLLKDDLALKHTKMSESRFAFLRATYYRWVQLFPTVLSDLNDAPRIVAIGDLHIENFGTYRDRKERLVWGVNDFDELAILPYTNDLARVATSATIAIQEERLALKPKAAYRAILDGYRDRIKKGRRLPFILGDKKNAFLRKWERDAKRNSESWWREITSLPTINIDTLPRPAIALLEKVGISEPQCAALHRRIAGLGSLAHRRIVAINSCKMDEKRDLAKKDKYAAFELKELGPAATDWIDGGNINWKKRELDYIYNLRLDDPFFHIEGSWLVRRIAPDCTRIELTRLPTKRLEKHLLYCAGAETANIHLANPKAAKSILRDLRKRHSDQEDWLSDASKAMAAIVNNDWKDWKSYYQHNHQKE
jgi:hypothetical protein